MARDGHDEQTAPTGEAGISSGALARHLGVSPTTLRSWDQRYGLGPARRDQGRHRRWSPDDVAMVEEMCRLTASGIPPAEAARVARSQAVRALPADRAEAGASYATGVDGSRPLPRAEYRGIARAALRLDSAVVQRQLNSFVRDHGVVAAWQEVMMPTLHAVGRRWESAGDRYVEVEHFLSWHVSTALRTAPLLLGQQASASQPAPAPASAPAHPPVLLACVPGEQHTLPLEAVHAELSVTGQPVRMLGAAVPAEALLEAVRRTGPAAVLVWAQTRSSASTPLAAHLLKTEWGLRGARRQPLVLLGGPGWRGCSVRGAVHVSGLREATTALRDAVAAASGS